MTRAARVVIVVVIAAALPLAAHSTAIACSTLGTGGVVQRTVNGRTYQLFVPSTLAAGVNVPLLVSFHGAGSDGTQHANQSGWPAFASSHGFIAAFPNGQFRTWQFSQGSPDVTFARAVVAQIRATYCVDGTRIYAGGHSNGAYFAGRLGCDAADLFAAVAPYAGGSPDTFGSACTPSQPVAVGQFHGSSDMVVPIAWGQAARDGWISRLACPTPPASESAPFGPLEHYRPCVGGVEVLWRIYNGQGHLWPTGAVRDDILARMWTFLTTYTN
jgi:polyhydroxybutyrate depolymerase